MLWIYNTLQHVQQAMMSTREESYDSIFRALADSRRREILDLLRQRARTTGELCEQFSELDRCTVMQHLSVLESADLIIVKREGRLRWNYLNPVPIKQLHDRWIGRYADNAVDLLARMKREIEALDN
jgi:DNA-binding transcriptional ArsR family regulator